MPRYLLVWVPFVLVGCGSKPGAGDDTGDEDTASSDDGDSGTETGSVATTTGAITGADSSSGELMTVA